MKPLGHPLLNEQIISFNFHTTTMHPQKTATFLPIQFFLRGTVYLGFFPLSQAMSGTIFVYLSYLLQKDLQDTHVPHRNTYVHMSLLSTKAIQQNIVFAKGGKVVVAGVTSEKRPCTGQSSSQLQQPHSRTQLNAEAKLVMPLGKDLRLRWRKSNGEKLQCKYQNWRGSKGRKCSRCQSRYLSAACRENHSREIHTQPREDHTPVQMDIPRRAIAREPHQNSF